MKKLIITMLASLLMASGLWAKEIALNCSEGIPNPEHGPSYILDTTNRTFGTTFDNVFANYQNITISASKYSGILHIWGDSPNYQNTPNGYSPFFVAGFELDRNTLKLKTWSGATGPDINKTITPPDIKEKQCIVVEHKPKI